MIYIAASAAIPLLMLFLFLQPKYKALIAFFLMMQCFDVLPTIMFGMYVWDYGTILMLITAVELFARRPVLKAADHAYLNVLKVFLAWLLICFVWSLLVYQYPVVHTIKNARYMVLGYFMTFVFIRLFAVQPESFEFMMKWCYRLSFALMPIVLLQSILKRALLFGLVTDYEGSVRALPVFLPFCLLNLWIIAAKFLSGEKVVVHEYLYASLALITVALTYTRGIYAAFVVSCGMLLWTLSGARKLRFSAIVTSIAAATLLLAILLASGLAQKVGGRAASGIDLLASRESATASKDDYDTFSGRLGLAAERFTMAWSRNPLVGFGFVHEDDVPKEVRHSLRFGTVLGGTAADPTAYARFAAFSDYNMLGLYSSDIAWADIVISTGCVGVLLLIAVMLTFFVGHFRDRDSVHPMGFAVKTGLFLETMMIFILTIDGNSFYGAVHIPAFLLAGYSLTGQPRISPQAATVQRRLGNLMT